MSTALTRFLLVFLAQIGGLLLLATGVIWGGQPLLDDRSRSIKNWYPMAQAIATADEITLYEGLPHQHFEPKEYISEARSKPTIRMGNDFFYQAPLPLTSSDARALTEIFRDKKNRKTLLSGSVKGCGGFHPDYAIEWKIGDKKYQALICFGCNEIQTYGPAGHAYIEMTSRGMDLYQKILLPYQAQRPPEKLPVQSSRATD